MSGPAFPDEALLREALEEVAEAEPGDYVEEPWGSTALAAAEQIASEGASPELVELARAAVERVAANSQLLELLDEPAQLEARIELLRARLARL
ncbi:MAG TPA: hypothetical protein VMT74_10005 [Gaiellaceae bacterium]|nr:hypothetical protein [Gaiellaceae bacterium]